MRKTILYISALSIFIASCGTPKQSINYRDLASKFYQEGNYQQSIENLFNYLNEQELKGEEPDPKVYSQLAEAYLETGNITEAERYYDWALTKNSVSEDLNIKMSLYYKKIDNLSKEITALEYYRDHFPSGSDSILMKNRMFETYMLSENWEPAQSAWRLLDETAKSSEKYLKLYFELNKQLENNEQCDDLAQQLLEFDSENKDALDWMAKKYYNLGENRYQSAMDIYNKKKTNKQYKILLKELDQVTIDLKKSLKYFDQLWEMKGGKKYAVYLANIYARFDDKKKSQYYKSFIK